MSSCRSVDVPHTTVVVQVRGFGSRFGLVLVNLLLLDDFGCSFDTRFVDSAASAWGCDVVESKVGCNSFGVEYHVLVLPLACTDGGRHRLVDWILLPKVVVALSFSSSTFLVTSW